MVHVLSTEAEKYVIKAVENSDEYKLYREHNDVSIFFKCDCIDCETFRKRWPDVIEHD